MATEEIQDALQDHAWAMGALAALHYRDSSPEKEQEFRDAVERRRAEALRVLMAARRWRVTDGEQSEKQT